MKDSSDGWIALWIIITRDDLFLFFAVRNFDSYHWESSLALLFSVVKYCVCEEEYKTLEETESNLLLNGDFGPGPLRNPFKYYFSVQTRVL